MTTSLRLLRLTFARHLAGMVLDGLMTPHQADGWARKLTTEGHPEAGTIVKMAATERRLKVMEAAAFGASR